MVVERYEVDEMEATTPCLWLLTLLSCFDAAVLTICLTELDQFFTNAADL